MALSGSHGGAPRFGTHTATIHVVLPGSFRLGLQLGRLSRSARPLFKAMGPDVDLDVGKLLATAALRHGGAPYPAAQAIQKETLQWLGWLDVHLNGEAPSSIGRSTLCANGH